MKHEEEPRPLLLCLCPARRCLVKETGPPTKRQMVTPPPHVYTKGVASCMSFGSAALVLVRELADKQDQTAESQEEASID